MSVQTAAPVPIKFGQFELEPHVQSALTLAIELARDEPVGAGHCLSAAATLRTPDAFRALAEMVNSPTYQYSPSQGDSYGLIQGTRELSESLDIATPFLGNRIWGRDLITVALLSDDPTLERFATEFQVSLSTLRTEWYGYVTSQGVRRSVEEWNEWWLKAGASLPRHFESEATDAAAQPAAYLLTWNPETGTSEHAVQRNVDRLHQDGEVDMSWTSGTRRHMPVGAKVFLLRQGSIRGIVGVGETLTEPRKDDHWDKDSSKLKAWMVDVRWSRLSVSPLIPIDELISHTQERKLWSAPGGGRRIDAAVVRKIEPLLGSRGQARTSSHSDISRFAQTISDLDHRNDWIGIRPDVEALSTLISVDQIEPPLSIAIFGDWGSGKTFLLRKLQERVAVLEKIGKRQSQITREQADESKGDQGGPRYCNSILQIEFNAWHYTESNLWASLLNHIFERLQEKLTHKNTDDSADNTDQVEALFQQFETARAARVESEHNLSVIHAEIDDAKEKVKTVQSELDSATKNLAAAVGRNAWDTLDSLLRESGDEHVAPLKEALHQFGFQSTLTSAQTVYSTLLRFRSVSGRAKQILGSLLATRRGILGAILVIATVAIASVAAIQFNNASVAIGMSILSVLTWLAERAGNAQKWLNRIQLADEWLTSAREREQTRISAAIETARATLSGKHSALIEAQRQLEDSQAREAHARSELQRLTARDQMRRFVDARISAQSYARHLGLVSMIRRDFEDLSDFMFRDSQSGEARLVRRVETTTLEAIPTIERIILYVDDLDRCQPDRVVEVLEAVHLLMSFRLFIVVVAVDPRWVFEALTKRYPHLRSGSPLQLTDSSETSSATRLYSDQASTHDYIEKIFHIPFWVKPMTPAACQDLVSGYFSFSEPRDNEKGDPASQSTDEGRPEEPDQPSKPRDRERYHEHSTRRQARGSTVTEQNVSTTTADTLSNRSDEERSAMSAIQSVSIGDDEQAFIRKLAPHLGNSPRRIKRFANIYRLLKAGLNIEEVSNFTSDSEGATGYEIALVFLAVVTGAPMLAPSILSHAYENRKRLDTLKLGSDLASLHNCEPDEVENARGILSLLDGKPVEASAVEIWAPRVMRYGFNLVPIDATETET